jgi:hypothetical protein
MGIDVRAMVLEETGAIIEFLHGTTPEHLAMLIVDPARKRASDRAQDQAGNRWVFKPEHAVVGQGGGPAIPRTGQGQSSLKSGTPSPVWFVESPTRCGTFKWSHAR